MKKVFFVLLISVFLIGMVSAQTQGNTTTELTVWGMTCNSCARDVTRTVSALGGVVNVSVNLRARKVTVVHNSTLDVDTIKRAIEARGYTIP